MRWLVKKTLAALAVALVAGTAAAQAPAPAAPAPLRIPTGDGEVILPTPADKQNYDDYGYAAIRRAGDLVYISGVVIGRRPDEGKDIPAFKDQVRRGFRRLGAYLKAAGLTFDDVAMIHSYHVWQGPNFSGTRAEQFKAFKEVKAEFMTGPSPAWTAAGVTSLLGDTGIVEVEMIAHARSRGRSGR